MSTEKSMQHHSERLNSEDLHIIHFAKGDIENPHNWHALPKWLTMISFASMFMLSFFATTTIIPAAPQVIKDLHVETGVLVYQTLLVSIWEFGEGIGPFFIGPLSERFGRRPVYHAGNLLSLLCAIAGALSTNISMLVAFRFLSGLVSVAPTLAPTVVGDLFPMEQRGAVMAVNMAVGQIGVFTAPIAGSFISQAYGWRWTMWINAIAIAAVAVPSIFTVRETFEVKILKRKVQRLQRETGNLQLRTPYEPSNSLEIPKILKSFTIPMTTLFHSRIVFLIATYTAFAYALSYLVLTTLTEVMENTYHFDTGLVGLAFLGAAIGSAIAMVFYGLASDPFLKMQQKRHQTSGAECRLVFLVVGSVIFPVGFFVYGWTLSARIPWIAPMIGTVIVGFGVMIIVLSTENYLVDTFGIRSASAISAGVITRAIAGALLPLAGPSLYQTLGLGWGNSLLAFLAMAFIPFILLLLRYNHSVGPSEIVSSELRHDGEAVSISARCRVNNMSCVESKWKHTRVIV